MNNAAFETPVPKRRGRPPKNRSAEDATTPLKLLDSAELQFAERGFYGVATREVAASAGYDDALIYYHFSSKKGLFNAVLERRAPLLNEVRRASLRGYAISNGGKMTLRGVIAAFINPMIDLSEGHDPGWKAYYAIVAQIDNTPWGADIIHRFFDPIVYELIALIKEIMPDCEHDEIYWAYNFLAGSMMLALSENERVDRLSHGACKARDLKQVRERLIDFCYGGFARLTKHPSV